MLLPALLYCDKYRIKKGTTMNLKKFTIAAIPGDGIGPEVMEAGLAVLARTGEKFGCEFTVYNADFLIYGMEKDWMKANDPSFISR